MLENTINELMSERFRVRMLLIIVIVMGIHVYGLVTIVGIARAIILGTVMVDSVVCSVFIWCIYLTVTCFLIQYLKKLNRWIFLRDLERLSKIYGIIEIIEIIEDDSING